MVVNAFVGAMVGLERSVLPVLGWEDFGLASRTAILSFLITFGIVKAGTNYFAGRLFDRFGRKSVLLFGWLAALPVPFMIIFAPSWGWVVAANVLLGINQGLTWSTTVIMKIDLGGPRRRGLAMGLSETARYPAVSLAALAAGYLAAAYGACPVPFLLGTGFAVAGLLLTVFFVRETYAYAELEAAESSMPEEGRAPRRAAAKSSSGRASPTGTSLSSGQVGLYAHSGGEPPGNDVLFDNFLVSKP